MVTKRDHVVKFFIISLKNQGALRINKDQFTVNIHFVEV